MKRLKSNDSIYGGDRSVNSSVKTAQDSRLLSLWKRNTNVIQLTLVQVIAMVAGGPVAMILTVLVGILVNNSVNRSNIEGLKSDLRRVEDSLRSELGGLRSDIQRVEDSLRSDLQRVEESLRSDIQRVEGVLTAKIDGLSTRVKALEDQGRSTLVKG